MTPQPYQARLDRCRRLMKAAGLDALLLTKPSNMFYLTGDGRLCSYALITQDAKVALGVPQTDVADVTQLAHFDELAGFEDEVGMIHGIAHHFKHFGLHKGIVGVEFTFLTQSMMRMVTHPHAKPEEIKVEDATPVLSDLRLVKEAGEIERLREAAHVAEVGMHAALEAVKPGLTESQLAAEAEHAMRQAAYDLFLQAQQATIAKVTAGVTMQELEQALHGKLKEGGHAGHIFGPPIHGVGIDFEEAPLPAGHAFFHGEKEPTPLDANVVIAVGNCGLYTGPFGVRAEDTVVVTESGPEVLTGSPRRLEC